MTEHSGFGPDSEPDPHPGPAPPSTLDPTKMANQRSLQTSTGLIWLVMGALFAGMSLIPFALLIAAERQSRGLAIVIAATILVLLAMMFVARFAIRPGRARLRTLAALMLSMAGISMLGIWICSLIEAAPLV